MYLKLGKRDISLQAILWITAVLALAAVGITLAVMLPGRNADTSSRTEPADEPAAAWVTTGHLVVENELERGTSPHWVPFREMKDSWTNEDAALHWLDPRQIGVDVLEEEVTTSIRRMLEEVP